MTYKGLKGKKAEDQDKEFARMALEDHDNKSRLAKRLGVTRKTVYERLKRPGVRKHIALLLEKCGMTDEYLCTKIREGLTADYPFREDGEVTREKDFEARHKYLRTALELKGHVKGETEGNNTNNVIINIIKPAN